MKCGCRGPYASVGKSSALYANCGIGTATKCTLDPDLEQLTVQAMDDRVSHTPALLLPGRVSELTESCEVEHEEDSGDDVFTWCPPGRTPCFEELRMTFDGDMLTELWMTDSTGQRTAIVFSDAERNVDIDDERFEFETPPMGRT